MKKITPAALSGPVRRRFIIRLARVSLLFIAFFLVGCHSQLDLETYEASQKAFEKEDYKTGTELAENLVKSYPESPYALKIAQQGKSIAQMKLKEPRKVVFFLKFIILKSQGQKELRESQEELASTYLDQLQDYPNAILELNRLLSVQTEIEQHHLRLMLAKAYYYSGNFKQSELEIEDLLKKNPATELKFEAELLKASVLVTKKKTEEAIALYSDLMQRYQEPSQKQDLSLSLALAYEEKGDYTRATETLEKIKSTYPDPHFIELKIERLEQRKLQLPGARGLKK